MLYRGGIDNHRLFGAVFARVTYDIVDERLVPADEQSWPVSAPPWDSDYGPMDSDEVFYRGGVDLFVFGAARPPAGEEAQQVEVLISVGKRFERRLVVFGERRWTRQGDELVPGATKQFREIPLSLANAYGGKDVWDELEVPFPDNPEGKGFYLEEEQAVGQPLPHIEDPDHLIRRWDDRPEPVGTQATPITFGPRARRGVVFDEETGFLKELKPIFFNAAFPHMVVPGVNVGDRVRISGVRTDGPLEFVLPHSSMQVRLEFGEEVSMRDLTIDQIGIEPDRMRAFVSFRYPFRYVLVPLQKRSCHLYEAKATSGS